MSYKPNYEGGWKSGESGGTPITPEALNHIEQGIEQTYSDFAPSGYGLGENGAYVSNLDALKTTGVFTFTHDATSNPFPGWGGVAVVLASKTTIKQILFCNKNNGLCVERSMCLDMDKTTFEPWEYRNPPLESGVQYRTTERWDKKPVYVKRMTFTSNTQNEFYFDPKVYFGVTGLVRVEGKVYSAATKYAYQIPSKNAVVVIEPDGYLLTTDFDMRNYTVDLTMYYVN